jgi:flagellar biosynthesis protein FlhA
MINLFVGYGLIPMVESSQGGDLADRIFMIRRQLALETGAITPTIRIQDDIKLSPNEYRIMIKGVDVAGGEIMFDHYLAINPGFVEEEVDGIETIEPSSGLPAMWISESQRERAEALGYNVFDSPAIIATHLTETIRIHQADLLTRQDVQNLIDNVKTTNPVLVDELVPKMMSVGDIQKVLANLLRERITIRDMVTILETLADYAIDAHGDTDMLTEQVRQVLRRSISKRFFSDGANMVLTLDPALEQLIIENIKQTARGSYIALEPGVTQNIFDNLQREVTKLTSMGLEPVILTSPIVRTYFKRLIDPIIPSLAVLSYNEIDTAVELQSVGIVRV